MTLKIDFVLASSADPDEMLVRKNMNSLHAGYFFHEFFVI